MAVVDTEGSFRAERLQQIGKRQSGRTHFPLVVLLPGNSYASYRLRHNGSAERFDVDKDLVLENVLVARAFTVDQQQHALVNVAAKMAEEPFRLLIVDR